MCLITGVSECDAKRNETTNPAVIVLPIFDGAHGSQGVENTTEPFVPVVPTWPTDSGTTEKEAVKECKEKLEQSTTYKVCAKVLGVQFTVKINLIYSQCVADIQVRLFLLSQKTVRCTFSSVNLNQYSCHTEFIALRFSTTKKWHSVQQ